MLSLLIKQDVIEWCGYFIHFTMTNTPITKSTYQLLELEDTRIQMTFTI